jgi:hypothetical protein
LVVEYGILVPLSTFLDPASTAGNELKYWTLMVVHQLSLCGKGGLFVPVVDYTNHDKLFLEALHPQLISSLCLRKCRELLLETRICPSSACSPWSGLLQRSTIQLVDKNNLSLLRARLQRFHFLLARGRSSSDGIVGISHCPIDFGVFEEW